MLFCTHNYEQIYRVRTYIDYSGFPVEIWKCRCKKCGKEKNKKFW